MRDNLIFGRIVTRHGRANERLKELITWVADDGGFRDQVVAAGLDFTVGIGGAHLTPQQRQKVVLAAGLLKSAAARLLIAHAPTGDLERSAARRILQQLLDAYRERTVICALDDPGLAALFERTVVLSRGQVVADGARGSPTPRRPAPRLGDPSSANAQRCGGRQCSVARRTRSPTARAAPGNTPNVAVRGQACARAAGDPAPPEQVAHEAAAEQQAARPVRSGLRRQAPRHAPRATAGKMGAPPWRRPIPFAQDPAQRLLDLRDDDRQHRAPGQRARRRRLPMSQKEEGR